MIDPSKPIKDKNAFYDSLNDSDMIMKLSHGEDHALVLWNRNGEFSVFEDKEDEDIIRIYNGNSISDAMDHMETEYDEYTWH